MRKYNFGEKNCRLRDIRETSSNFNFKGRSYKRVMYHWVRELHANFNAGKWFADDRAAGLRMRTAIEKEWRDGRKVLKLIVWVE